MRPPEAAIIQVTITYGVILASNSTPGVVATANPPAGILSTLQTSRLHQFLQNSILRSNPQRKRELLSLSLSRTTKHTPKKQTKNALTESALLKRRNDTQFPSLS
eukprot:TRINITY_DN40285_c0_g1_i1.p3 TRINITY_DN40285_c0_g1~~TRINITY_DN40285_c0_g1_i1.p3  ORF type:complete len:105 (+),score=5.00 TRINITY_DN40285_c0_g1_i1:1105-1419(+)